MATDNRKMQIFITNIDDSIECHKSPYLYFWGLNGDLKLLFQMKNYIKLIESHLEKFPSINLEVLGTNNILCVIINKGWHRAKISKLKLNNKEEVVVLCIDSGIYHTTPLTSIRTLEIVIPGSPIEYIRKWPALAPKYMLGDICAPYSPTSSKCQWTSATMKHLKCYMELQTWDSLSLAFHESIEIVRLFYPESNRIFASSLLEKRLCEATDTCVTALAMHELSSTSLVFSPSVPCKRFIFQTVDERNDFHVKKLKTAIIANSSPKPTTPDAVFMDDNSTDELSDVTNNFERMEILEDVVFMSPAPFNNRKSCDKVQQSVDIQHLQEKRLESEAVLNCLPNRDLSHQN